MIAPKDVLAPYGVEEFLGTVWGQRTELLRGAAGRYRELLPWSLLNDILRRGRLETPRVRLARHGEQIPAQQYTVTTPLRRGGSYARLRFDALGALLRDGATLVVDSIDELAAPVDDLAAAFERVLREKVQVNCYASFGAVHGFDTHWDDHDVLVLQVHGRKRWRVFGPTREHAAYRDVAHPPAPAGDPEHDVVLEEGDALHVPRGWWHDATASDEPSLHLTFGVNRATGADLLSWLVDDLRRQEIVRADLPRFAGEQTRRDRVEALAEAVSKRLDEPDLLDRFFARRDAAAPPRGHPSLPWTAPDALGEDVPVRLVTPRAVLTEHQNTVELAADGRAMSFAPAAAPALAALVDGRAWTPDALATVSGLEPAAVDGLCADLVRLGVAAVDGDVPLE